MKRAIAVIVITLILITGGIVEAVLVNRLLTDFQISVTSIYEKFPPQQHDITQLSPEILAIKQKWSNHEPILCIIFNHKDLSVITDGINKLHTATTLNDYNSAKQELNLLYEYAFVTPHNMSFTFQNVF